MVSKLRIIPISEEFYKVKVFDKTETMHTVAMTNLDYERFTGGRKPKEKFVLFAFKFLFKREENTSILREFAICKISEYFSEFEQEAINWSQQ